MKKHLIASLALMLALIACKRETQQPEVDPVDPETEQMAMTFTAKLPRVKVTKSEIGVLENKWNPRQDLYIYGIARQGQDAQAPANAPLNISEGRFIDNKLISLPESFDYDVITPQSVMVYKELPDDERGFLGVPYFYDDEHSRYEFFGYYADDAWRAEAMKNKNGGDSLTEYGHKVPVPFIDEKGITLPVEINGSQDLLLAHTNKEADNVHKINSARLYSGYSARRGVVPNLVFEHQLARFNVYVRAGDNLSDRLTLTTLAIETYTEGTLHIANTDQFNNPPYLEVNREGNRPFIGIWDETFTKQLDDSIDKEGLKYNLPLVNFNGWFNTRMGTLMVMPGEKEYKICVGLRQRGYNNGQEFRTSIVFSFDDLLLPSQDPKGVEGVSDPEVLDSKAEAGHQYDLNIVVYGIQQMDMSVSLSEWAEGGSFVVDEDKEVEIRLALDMPDDPMYGFGTKDNPIKLDLADSQSYELNATTVPEGREITYTSKNTDIATVSNDGIIYPGLVDEGAKTYIAMSVEPFSTYLYGGYRRVWVEVFGELPTETLVVNVPQDTLHMTLHQQNIPLNPVVTCNGKVEEDVTLTYTTSSEEVVFVDPYGYIAANGEGTATVTVQAHKRGFFDGFAHVQVHVTKPRLEIDLLSGDTMQLRVMGESKQIEYAIHDNLGESVDEDKYTIKFASENTEIAEVTADGIVKPVSPGDAVISITAVSTDGQYLNSFPATVKVHVDKQPAVKITLKETGIKKVVGDEPFDLNDLIRDGFVSIDPEDATVIWSMASNDRVTLTDGHIVTILGRTPNVDITITASYDTYVSAQEVIHLAVARGNTDIEVSKEVTLKWEDETTPPQTFLSASLKGGAIMYFTIIEGSEYLNIVGAQSSYTGVQLRATKQTVNQNATAKIRIYAPESDNYNSTETIVTVKIVAFKQESDEDPSEGGDTE